jgi:hypothetical protein
MIRKWKANSQKAQGMVEFALVLPLLMMLILGIFAFGHFMFIYSTLSSASREGARYGAVVGLSENNKIRFEDCKAIRDAAMRVGGFGGLMPENVKIYYYDETTSTPNPTDTAHLIGRCQDTNNVNVADIVYADPLGSGVGLGDRIEVRATVNYIPLVPFVNLPSFPIQSFSVRTILRNVAIGTVPPANSPGGGGSSDPSKANLDIVATAPESRIVGRDIVVSWIVSDTSSTLNPTENVLVSIPLWDGGNYGTFATCSAPAIANPLAPASDPDSFGNRCTLVGGADWAGDNEITLVYPEDGEDTDFNEAAGFALITLRYNTVVTLSGPNGETSTTSLLGENVSFKVTVTSDPVGPATVQAKAPLGTVRILDAVNNQIGPEVAIIPVNNYSSEVTIVHPFATYGTRQLRAEFTPYSGNEFVSTDPSNTISHRIVVPYTLAMSLSVRPVQPVGIPAAAEARVNQTVELTVTLDRSSPSIPSTVPNPGITDMLIQDLNSPNSCVAILGTTANGLTGKCTMSVPGVAVHTFKAVFGGDSNYGDVEAIAQIPVIKGDTTIAFTNWRATVGSGQRVTYSWNVSAILPSVAANSAQPGGTVTVVSSAGGLNGTCTGPAPIGSCVLVIPYSGTVNNTATITATYGGDVNFNPSPSTSNLQTVSPCPEFKPWTQANFVNGTDNGFFFADLENVLSSAITITSITVNWQDPNAGANYPQQAHFVPVLPATPTTVVWECTGNNPSCVWRSQGQERGTHDLNTRLGSMNLGLACGSNCYNFNNNTDATRTIPAQGTDRLAFSFSSLLSPGSNYSMTVTTNNPTCPTSETYSMTKQ